MRFGLKFKIGFLVSLLVVALLGAVGWFSWQRIEQALEEEINAKGIALARSLASNVAEMLPAMAISPMASVSPEIGTANHMESMDYAPLVYDHTRNTLNEAGVLYAVVVYKDGRVFAQCESAGLEDAGRPREPKAIIRFPSDQKFSPYGSVGLLPADLPTDQNYLSTPLRWDDESAVNVAVPIELRNAKGDVTRIGEVHVGISTLAAEKTTRYLLTIVLIIAAIGIAGGITASILLGLALTRNIDRLVRGVQQIGQGNFDVSVPVRSRDEIGGLTISINEMARALKEKEFIKDAFRRYVSHQVADQILLDPEQYQKTLKGERRQVAIIFADIRGFTTISERLPPEQVVELLNEYLTHMTEVIFKYEGTLDKFLGDGLMAIFGAPIPQEDAVLRAVRTALEMREKLLEMNEKRALIGDNPIRVGIGINWGDAIVGNIGSKQRMDYTVIGDTVNVASRIQTRAEEGEVLISKAAYEQIAGKVEVRDLGEMQLKGKTRTVGVYEVIGVI